MKNYHEELHKAKKLVDLTERLFLRVQSTGNKIRLTKALDILRLLQENNYPKLIAAGLL